MDSTDERDKATVQPNAVVEVPSTPKLLGVSLAVVLAVAAFFSGYQLSQSAGSELSQQASLFSFFLPQTAAPETADLSELWRVWNLMEEKFAAASSTEELSVESRIEGMIQGLVRSYDDPYTSYLPAADAEQFNEDIAGNFGGVGMEVGMRNEVITIISPLPNTPAEQAGLLAGDVIVSIDDTSTQDMNVDQAVRLIRGEAGTEVVLEVFRSGATEILTVPVVRDNITIPTIETEVAGDVFIIKMYSFNALVEAQMQDALREYVESGTSKIILDLRGNPGGYLQSAISIAGYFLPTGKVVVREQFGDDRPEEVYRSVGRDLRQYTPEAIVVLINGGSASASEILAGALQEQGVATVIGEASFGKGSVQELINLPKGASLKVTIARWLTPNGTSLSEGGLTPDIIIGRTIDQLLADEDPQLDAALRFLAGEEVVSETEGEEIAD